MEPAIFVKGFPSETTQSQIQRFFESAGRIKSAKIVKNFAFVIFQNMSEAQKAVQKYNGRNFNNSRDRLIVQITKPKDGSSSRNRDGNSDPNSRPTGCFFCKKQGHYKIDCPQLKGRSNFGSDRFQGKGGYLRDQEQTKFRRKSRSLSQSSSEVSRRKGRKQKKSSSKSRSSGSQSVIKRISSSFSRSNSRSSSVQKTKKEKMDNKRNGKKDKSRQKKKEKKSKSKSKDKKKKNEYYSSESQLENSRTSGKKEKSRDYNRKDNYVQRKPRQYDSNSHNQSRGGPKYQPDNKVQRREFNDKRGDVRRDNFNDKRKDQKSVTHKSRSKSPKRKNSSCSSD